MKLTGKAVKIINIILLIGITIINGYCENLKLRHEAGVIYLLLLNIIITWYALTNKPIKNREVAGLIFFYIVSVLGFIYLLSINFK